MARFVFFSPWSTLVEFNPRFFLFFKNLASIRNPAAYQAAIYARLQREYLEWRKDEDLREKARKEREERKAAKAAYLAKPPPPGFTKDSKGYLRRIRPEEMATRTVMKKITKDELAAKRAGWLLRNSTNRAAAFAAARSVGMSIPPTMSGTTMQAIRTGGWANPSLGGELKYIDTNANTALTFASSAFSTGVLLNGVAQGSDATARIGRKMVMKSLLLRWTWNLASTSTGGSPVRVMVVYDKQANATAPAITDVLVVDSFVGQNNLNNRDRFVVLCDYLSEPIGANGNTSVGGVIYKRLNLETMFNSGSAGTIGDITSGSVYLFVSQTGGILVANPTFNWRARVRFTDV